MASRKQPSRVAGSTNTSRTHEKRQVQDKIIQNAAIEHPRPSKSTIRGPSYDDNIFTLKDRRKTSSGGQPHSRQSSQSNQSNQQPSGNSSYCEVCMSCASAYHSIATPNEVQCPKHNLPLNWVTSHQCPSNVSSQQQLLAPPPVQDGSRPSQPYAGNASYTSSQWSQSSSNSSGQHPPSAHASPVRRPTDANYAYAGRIEQGQSPYPQASGPNPGAASPNASRSHASSLNVPGHRCDVCGRQISR